MGRRGPVKEYPERLTVPVTSDVKASLATMADSSGTSLASVVRGLLTEAMQEDCRWGREPTN